MQGDTFAGVWRREVSRARSREPMSSSDDPGGPEGARKRGSARYARVMLRSQSRGLCGHFGEVQSPRVTRRNAVELLVMKGSGVRVSPSALHESPVSIGAFAVLRVDREAIVEQLGNGLGNMRRGERNFARGPCQRRSRPPSDSMPYGVLYTLLILSPSLRSRR